MIASRPSRAGRDVLLLSPQPLYGAAALATLLVLWLLATTVTGAIPSNVLPSPFELVARIVALVTEPFSGATLEGHALRSLERWIIGVAAAIAIGVPTGIALAWLPPVRAAVTPIFELLRYIPPFA